MDEGQFQTICYRMLGSDWLPWPWGMGQPFTKLRSQVQVYGCRLLSLDWVTLKLCFNLSGDVNSLQKNISPGVRHFSLFLTLIIM